MIPAVLAVLATGAAAFLYASVVELHWFALRRHRIPCLPQGSEPLTILHISDLHYRGSQRRKKAFLASLGSLSADLAVATGDFLGDSKAAEAVVEALAPIKARLGGLFVLGSHDYYVAEFKTPFSYFLPKGPLQFGRANAWKPLVERLESHGWTPIGNRAMALTAPGGDEIDIVGLDDPHIERHDMTVATPRKATPEAAPGDARTAGAATQTEPFRLAVVHSPGVAEALADLGYDLILAGHTHGGQVRVPGIGALVTNCEIPRAMARGAHKIGRSWLHVSAGLGTSRFAPIRFACRPEACLLELTPREDGRPSP